MEIVGRCPACARRLARKGLRRERRWDCTWLVDWNRFGNKYETQHKVRVDSKFEGEICVATSTLPPSNVTNVQEGGSFDIAFR